MTAAIGSKTTHKQGTTISQKRQVGEVIGGSSKGGDRTRVGRLVGQTAPIYGQKAISW